MAPQSINVPTGYKEKHFMVTFDLGIDSLPSRNVGKFRLKFFKHFTEISKSNSNTGEAYFREKKHRKNTDVSGLQTDRKTNNTHSNTVASVMENQPLTRRKEKHEGST